MKITVIGSGNGGTAFTGYLTYLGHQVKLFTRTPQKVELYRAQPEINLAGVVNATVPVGLVTLDMEEAIRGSELIMVATPANTHKEIATKMAPYLKSGQTVVLNPGRTFGAYEFAHTLESCGCTADVTVAETDTLVFTCRNQEFNHPIIYSIKEDIRLACLEPERTPAAVELMQELFSGIHGVPSILYTGLTNIGMIFHPTPILLNYTRIESGQTFLYYKEAITPMVAQYISQVDAERVAVAAGLGLEVETALEWLVRSYGIEPGADLYETIQKNPAYADVYAPQSTDCRYVWEDVPTGLVPISSVGRLLGIPTPFIDTVIQLACTIYRVDFRQTGRMIANQAALARIRLPEAAQV